MWVLMEKNNSGSSALDCADWKMIKCFLKYVVKVRRRECHVADTYHFSKHSKASQQEMTNRTIHSGLIRDLKSTDAVIKALSSLWIILSWMRFTGINKWKADLTIHSSAVFSFGIITFSVDHNEKIITGCIIFGIINMLCSSINRGQPSPFQQFWRIYLCSAAVGKAYWLSWKPWDKNTQRNTWTLGCNRLKLI